MVRSRGLGGAAGRGRTGGTRRARTLGLCAALILLASPVADGQPPGGEGGPDRRPIPDPPLQGQPWTPPETTLPRFLASATEALFAHGVADPRGCEYREVTPAPPSGAWRGGEPARANAFVLPAVAGDDRRFTVGWDGSIVRVRDIGPEADLEADVRARAEALREDREDAERDPSRRPGSRFWRIVSGDQDRTTGPVSPMQVCILLRLGRADLAEALFAAATPWRPDGPRPDLTDYGVSYLTLANEWANALYVRGVDAHGRGDDGLALDAFRRVSTFRDLAEAHAAAMGFPLAQARGPGGEHRPTHFPRLTQLDELRADQERRALEPPRGPIPGRDADPDARVAALILNLDQIAEHQMSSPGAAHPGGSPLVRDLIAMGDPAVEPLLEALVHDTRMTRSISFGRGISQERRVSPTTEAIIPALDGLMKTGVPGITFEMRNRPDAETRRALAAAYRPFWEANRAVSPAERYYRILADDAEDDRWIDAARGLASSVRAAPGRIPPPMLGEPLRDESDPSITALMIRRVEELARPSGFGPRIRWANELAVSLARWDPSASLPVLHALMDQSRAAFAADTRPDSGSRPPLARSIAGFTLSRARAGDREALDEYAAWVATTTPESLGDARLEALEPMWVEPDHPAIARASRAMFAGPDSPWRSMGGPNPPYEQFGRDVLETSPLIRVPAFREMVLDRLADETVVGTVVRRADRPDSLSYELEGGQSGSMSADLDPMPIGEERPVRACDWLARRLAALDGTPRFELYWPEPRRDEAIAALATFLRRHGDRYEATSTAERAGPFESLARLAFPRLDRPATPADVEAGRAIFSLEGQGDEVRVVPLPEPPLAALWTTLEDTPLVSWATLPTGETQVRRSFDRTGRVWQAEEVRVGDRWERSFGFVGPSTVGRAPADEVVFPAWTYPHMATPEGRFDVSLTLAEPPEDPESGFRPGTPLVVAVRLRNLTGLDQAAPAEFVRPGPDGGPALRPGVALQLWRSDVSPTDLAVGDPRPGPPEEIVPGRDARFAPGGATRTLGPAEAIEAFRLDLRDWFDVSRPGQYRLVITFADESGVGPVEPGGLSFRVGE